tara:strand:- start:3656 stop:3760 length:105 start_codon:yes stop_codon:yes gene_type:complete
MRTEEIFVVAPYLQVGPFKSELIDSYKESENQVI